MNTSEYRATQAAFAGNNKDLGIKQSWGGQPGATDADVMPDGVLTDEFGNYMVDHQSRWQIAL